MKRHLITIGFTSLLAVGAMAQGPAKGRLFGFGTVGYTSTKPSGKDAKSGGEFTFAPGAGYFITDNVALGAKLLFSKQFADQQSGGTKIGLAAFGRYYFTKDILGAKGGFFGEGALSFQSETPLYASSGTAAKSATTIGLGIAPGFAIFPADKYGFEFTLPNLLGFYTTSNDGGSGFGIGASSISGPTVTFLYFLK